MNGRFLEGRVAVVTGGNRGIGRATALALAGAGAKVAISGRNQEKIAETLALLKAAGADAAGFTCDMRDEAQVKKLAEDVVARFGSVHILVNNAGTAIRKNVIDFTMEEWRALTDTNITGVWLACKYFVAGRNHLPVVMLSDAKHPHFSLHPRASKKQRCEQKTPCITEGS